MSLFLHCARTVTLAVAANAKTATLNLKRTIMYIARRTQYSQVWLIIHEGWLAHTPTQHIDMISLARTVAVTYTAHCHPNRFKTMKPNTGRNLEKPVLIALNILLLQCRRISLQFRLIWKLRATPTEHQLSPCKSTANKNQVHLANGIKPSALQHFLVDE